MSKIAQERYDKSNTTQFKMKLNTKTDADIIEWLNNQDNKQGKVKQLIRIEIARTTPPAQPTIMAIVEE